MAYVSNILWYVNSKRESVPSWILVKFYNGNTFLSEISLNVWDVIPQASIPTVSPSDIYYSWNMWTFNDDSDPYRRIKYTPTWSWFTLDWVTFDFTQPIKDNITLVACATSTIEYAISLTTIEYVNWWGTTIDDLWYIFVPTWTSVSYQTFKNAGISIDFTQYGPYMGWTSTEQTAYRIWGTGSLTAFNMEYVWSDNWHSEEILTSSNVNALIMAGIVAVNTVTITLEEYSYYSSPSGFVDWSENSITIPAGSSFTIPEFNNTQTPVDIWFSFLWGASTLTVKTVTLTPQYMGSHLCYIYWIWIGSVNFIDAEWTTTSLYSNGTIRAFGAPQAPIRVMLSCDYWIFKDSNNKEYCWWYNVYDVVNIYWDTSTNILDRIYVRLYDSGTELTINSIEPAEWYLVKWVDVCDTTWTLVQRVDNNNHNYSTRNNCIIKPYTVEYHWYPHYWFDGKDNTNSNLWWDWWMSQYWNNQPAGRQTYIYDTFEWITWTRPSYFPNMYWNYNELFYVEWLTNNWTLDVSKIYCFMTAGEAHGAPYFVVDVTNSWFISYTTYSHTFTVSSATDLWYYIMTELMAWNWCWWTDTFYLNRFYENAARDLYITSPSLYNQKFSSYLYLKDNITSWYGNLELI